MYDASSAALIKAKCHISRGGMPVKNNPGINIIAPIVTIHQEAMNFCRDCLSNRFQSVCKEAERKSSAMARRGIQGTIILSLTLYLYGSAQPQLLGPVNLRSGFSNLSGMLFRSVLLNKCSTCVVYAQRGGT
jgi:hypothetical protein